jgi:hypothetical protein
LEIPQRLIHLAEARMDRRERGRIEIALVGDGVQFGQFLACARGVAADCVGQAESGARQRRLAVGDAALGDRGLCERFVFQPA